MLLLEGNQTTEQNNMLFTRDPFEFLYEKLPGGGHKVTVCYLLDGDDYVGSYGPGSRKQFTPEHDATIRREMQNVRSEELRRILFDLVNSDKYNAAVANNVPGAEKKKVAPLDLEGGRLCLVKKCQFNWISKPTFAKRFGQTGSGEDKFDAITRARINAGFGAPDAAYDETDWQTKSDYGGTRSYYNTTGSKKRGSVHTDDHGGSAIYTRPWEDIKMLTKADLPYMINGTEVIDADGHTMFGTEVEFGGKKVSADSPVLVDMDTYNQIVNLWTPMEAKRFGTAGNQDIMYRIPIIADARYGKSGEFDDSVMIRQSYDRSNRGYKVLFKGWFYIESNGNFVEISEELVKALAAKGEKKVEAICQEEQDFIKEIREIEDGTYGQETFDIDKLLYMNCDKYHYIGDEAVARALGIPVNNVRNVIEQTGSEPNFEFQHDAEMEDRARWARSMGYDTDDVVRDTVREYLNDL